MAHTCANAVELKKSSHTVTDEYIRDEEKLLIQKSPSNYSNNTVLPEHEFKWFMSDFIYSLHENLTNK